LPLATLINQRTVAQLAFVDKELRHLEDLTGSNEVLQMMIVGFLLLLSLLAVMGVFFTRFEGRSLQLAVLRALGYSRFTLTKVLLLEGFLMGLMSIALGALIEISLAPFILSTVGTRLPSIQTENWPPWMILVTGALALLAVIIASLPPMLKLYKQDVHSALRNL
jgi:ABC-type antimicrobial peptide transport system permease subunit